MSTTFSPQINVLEFLSSLDLFIIAISVLGTFSFAWFGHFWRSKQRTSNPILEQVVMSRQLTLPLFVATLVTSWYGGIFGVTAIAFKQGIYNFITQGVFWYAAYLIFAFFLAERLRGHNAVTLPELVAKTIGPSAGKVAAVFNFFNVLPISYLMSLGIVVQMLTGWNHIACLLMSAGLGLVVTIGGGFSSLVFADILQFLLMYAAVIAVMFFSVSGFGGIDFLTQSLPTHYFDFSGGETLMQTFAWGFIAIATLVDPCFYQRCLAAKDARTAKIGIIVSTMFWCVFDLCTTFGAMYAAALIPNAPADRAYLFYGLQLLPDGLRGLLIAGIFATILSTLDAFGLVAANTLSYDLSPKRLKSSVMWNRANYVITLAIACMFALYFDGSIKKAWKTMGSYSAGCLLIPLVLVLIFNKKLRESQFIVSSLVSALVMTIWAWSPLSGTLDRVYVGIAISGILIAGMGMASYQGRGA